jgi:adenylate cyclase
VIGDPVNEAARLCDLAKERHDPVIASAAALRHAAESERGEWEVRESTVLRGRIEPTGLATPHSASVIGVRPGSEPLTT